jgi:nitroreductase
LRALAAAAATQGARLHVLDGNGVLELAAATSFAQRAEAVDESWQAELAYWTGGTRPSGTGVPDAAIPASPTQTTVPSRDFGHAGTLPVGVEHDRAATFAILYGDEDTPLDWLRAGEALSAVWLASTAMGISLVPMSAAVEIAATRRTLRRLLSDVGVPYLVVRLGHAEASARSMTSTPRSVLRIVDGRASSTVVDRSRSCI